jgi:hypothetical protein
MGSEGQPASAAKHVHLLVVAQGEGFWEARNCLRMCRGGFPPEAPVEVAPGEWNFGLLAVDELSLNAIE